MAQVVASGRAKSVEDAYRLATFEEMPVLVKERARKTIQEEMQKKASNSIAPLLVVLRMVRWRSIQDVMQL